MWKIKNLEINSKVVLAPMAGITFASYREFMSQFGFGVCVTEMVSDMGLIYGNKETESYITFKKGNGYYTGVQLFGHDPETLKKAALICLEKNQCIDFVDINMGCPVPKVTDTGAGSSLMKNPKLCGDIIRAIKSVTDKPVTAKIRLGWNNESINFLEVIEELEKAGVDMIAIHSRTRKELYAGEPHHNLLKDLGNKMSVPLVVSGNIFSLEDAINVLNLTKASAVMVARGGMGNPFLLKQINQYFEDGTVLEKPSLKEQINYCEKLGKMIIEEKGEDVGMRIYRTIAPKFFSGFSNMKKYRNRLVTELVSYESLINILKDIAAENNVEF